MQNYYRSERGKVNRCERGGGGRPWGEGRPNRNTKPFEHIFRLKRLQGRFACRRSGFRRLNPPSSKRMTDFEAFFLDHAFVKHLAERKCGRDVSPSGTMSRPYKGVEPPWVGVWRGTRTGTEERLRNEYSLHAGTKSPIPQRGGGKCGDNAMMIGC